MSLDDFVTISDTRIPTPAEFVRFVEGQGWLIRVTPDGRAALGVKDKTDPVAIATAKMLSREPWRSEVIRVVAPPNKSSATDTPPPPKPTDRPQGVAVCEDHALLRAGTCKAKSDGFLAWSHYRQGWWYWFEETLIPNNGLNVNSFRVFTTDAVGYAGRKRFESMFEEAA